MNRLHTVLLAAGLLCAALSGSAKVVTQPVVYEHAGVKLEGLLAYDDAVTTPRPGVLVVHEWWGLNDYVKGRAKQLAEMGYVAFALDMYGQGVVTRDAKKAGELAGPFYADPKAWAARARAGLDQLLATGKVAPNHVASIGFCFGGSTSLVLAYSGAPLAGVVSFHGALVPAVAATPGSVKARVLVQHGEADSMITAEQIAAFKAEMDQAGADYRFVELPGAKHGFSNPDADAHKGHGLDLGYQKEADERSWADMQALFKEVF